MTFYKIKGNILIETIDWAILSLGFLSLNSEIIRDHIILNDGIP